MTGASPRGRTDRFFSDFYDSTMQRGYAPLARTKPDDAARLIGRMRLDLLLAERLVITDAQLLDGSFLLSQEPARLLSLLNRHPRGVELPIEVRARSTDLGEALRQFVAYDDRPTLRGFTFSSIEDAEQRLMVKEELQRVRPDQVRDWKQLAALLGTMGVESGNIARVSEGWERWIRAAREGQIQVTLSTTARDVDAFLSPGVDLGLATDTGRNALARVYELRHDRSSIDTYLQRIGGQCQSDSDRPLVEDLSKIYIWYNRAYTSSIASAAGCPVFESVRDFTMNADRAETIRLADGSPADLIGTLSVGDKDVQLALGNMDDGRFTELFYKNEAAFRKWWASGDESDLAAAWLPFAEAIDGSAERKRSAVLPEWTDLGTNLLVAAAGLTVGGALGPWAGMGTFAITLGASTAFKFVDSRLKSRGKRKIVQRVVEVSREKLRKVERHG